MVALVLLLLNAAPPSPEAKAIVAAHRACKLEKSAAGCAEAVARYPAYLQREPGDSLMRFFYAELLWDQHRYGEAAVLYREVAMDATCKHAATAAYDFVLARKELVNPVPERVHDGKPWPLDVEQQALVDAVDFYLARMPGGREAGAVAYTAARLYLKADDLDEAQRRAEWMLERDLQKEDARWVLDQVAEARVREAERRSTIGTPQTIGEPQSIGGAEDDEEVVVAE